MNIHIQEDSPSQYQEMVRKHESEMMRHFVSFDHTLNVYFYEDLTAIKTFDADNCIYIIGSKPLELLSEFEPHKISDGHVITIIADSRSLYTSKTAKILTESLKYESFISHTQSLQYFTALQECVLNAIEHGNLGLSKDKKDGLTMLDNIERYHQTVKETLEKDSLGEKAVIITCEVRDEHFVTAVQDNGEGYNVKKALGNRKKQNTLLHSRGLRLIEGLTDDYAILDNGRCVEFKLKAQFLTHQSYSQFSMKEMRKKCKVLIVDDQEANTKIARFYLESVGYENVITCNCPVEAVEKAKDIKPDLIILDIVMPEMNGFTACRKIKMQEECRNTPILFFSSLDDSVTRTKGYRLGAVDYVAKPLQKNELVARTDAHIQNGLLYCSLKAYIEKVNKDMGRAKQAQIELLPSEDKLEMIKKKYELEIGVCFKTCYELAGDYWTVEDLGDGRIALIMADFTGHGVAASLNTVRLHAYIQEFYNYLHSDVETFIKRINQRLKDTIPLEDFATFVCAILDTRKNELNYIGCGNPPIAIIPFDEDSECRFLTCEGLPLGIENSPKLPIYMKNIQLDHGDSLLFFSDALLETRHLPEHKMWGEKTLLKKLTDIKVQYTFPDLKDILETFNETALKPLDDDLTVLHISYKNAEASKELLQSYMHPDSLGTELSG